MRYWIGFVLFALALGTLRVVGCGDGDDGPPEPAYPECRNDAECDDDNACTVDMCKDSHGNYFGLCEHWQPNCDLDECGQATERCDEEVGVACAWTYALAIGDPCCLRRERPWYCPFGSCAWECVEWGQCATFEPPSTWPSLVWPPPDITCQPAFEAQP